MPIEPEGASAALGRAHAITVEQVALAKEIVRAHFDRLSADTQSVLAGQIVQALATNYLAEVTRHIDMGAGAD